jgi:hypothetical protein
MIPGEIAGVRAPSVAAQGKPSACASDPGWNPHDRGSCTGPNWLSGEGEHWLCFTLFMPSSKAKRHAGACLLYDKKQAGSPSTLTWQSLANHCAAFGPLVTGRFCAFAQQGFF